MIVFSRGDVDGDLVGFAVRQERREGREVDKVSREVERAVGRDGAPDGGHEPPGVDADVGVDSSSQMAIDEQANFAEGALAVGRVRREVGDDFVRGIEILDAKLRW